MANKRVVQLIVGGRVHEDGSVRSMRLRRSHRWLSRRWRWLELPGPRAQAVEFDDSMCSGQTTTVELNWMGREASHDGGGAMR